MKKKVAFIDLLCIPLCLEQLLPVNFFKNDPHRSFMHSSFLRDYIESAYVYQFLSNMTFSLKKIFNYSYHRILFLFVTATLEKFKYAQATKSKSMIISTLWHQHQRYCMILLIIYKLTTVTQPQFKKLERPVTLKYSSKVHIYFDANL